MTLQTRAMLANLNIRQWSARKYDKDVSRDVEIAKQANDAGRFNKQLIAKTQLARISQIAGQIRDFHYTNTLPWGDNGDRLLPSARYLDYTAELHKKRDQFASAVAAFILVYPNEVQAARTRLGQMYNPDDYPDVSDIENRFSVDASFMPVPDAADFRCEVSAEDAAAIKEQITSAVAARQLSAVKELWFRLRGDIEAMQGRLQDPKAVFRDSLVENLRELADLIPKLNITGDEKIISVCHTVRHSLLVNPDTLRHDKVTRARTAATANLILAQIQEHLDDLPVTHLSTIEG